MGAIWRWLLTPVHEAALKIVTVAAVLLAVGLLVIILYQAHVIAEQRSVIDWFEERFLFRQA